MDYCLLEDAFKENTGCKDNFSADQAKKHERKKMKKRNECFKPISASDPDRPAYEQQNSSVSLKELSEAFIDISANKIPAAIGTKLPSYFLGDDDIEGFTNSFSAVEEVGFDKSSGTLPIPSVSDTWKPLTPSTGSSAYFKHLPTPGGVYPVTKPLKPEPREFKVEPRNDLQEKIDKLIKRLDELENTRRSPNNNQNEIIAFVGTGIFMIFALSLLKR